MQRSRAWGNPFFPPPSAATPYCRLSKERASILSSTCRIGISFESQQRVRLHKQSRSQTDQGGLEQHGRPKKTPDDSRFRYAKTCAEEDSSSAAQSGAPLLCRCAPHTQCRRLVMRFIPPLNCNVGLGTHKHSPQTCHISGGGVAQTVRDFQTDGTEHLGDETSSCVQKICVMEILNNWFLVFFS